MKTRNQSDKAAMLWQNKNGKVAVGLGQVIICMLSVQGFVKGSFLTYGAIKAFLQINFYKRHIIKYQGHLSYNS